MIGTSIFIALNDLFKYILFYLNLQFKAAHVKCSLFTYGKLRITENDIINNEIVLITFDYTNILNYTNRAYK